jgi:membrane-associated phospholipid phosphatase
MRQLNEIERILTVFGAFLVIAALTLSLGTEISARNHVAAYRKRFTHTPDGIVQQGKPLAHFEKHIGYDQETLASRWSFPDGHGTLGAGFAVFGLILVAVPRAAARKRAAVA